MRLGYIVRIAEQGKTYGIRAGLAHGGSMDKYVTIAEMQAVEKEANEKGLTYSGMMENAGKGLAAGINNAYS